MKKIGRGQISIGLLAFIGSIFSASLGLGYFAMTKADRAVEQVSGVRESVAEIRTDVRWIRETLSGSQKVLGTTTSSSKYNGY